MIDKKLRRIQLVIVILLGLFWFVGCGTGPQIIEFKSCEEKAGVEEECRTFKIEAKASILPF